MDEQVIAVMVLEAGGHTLDVNIPMDRGRMTSMVQEGLGVKAPSEAEVVFVNSDLPFISADLGADADMLNDLASLAAGLTDEQREAAELYWDSVISVSEQDKFQAAANVLMQANEIEQWHAYDYYVPEAGWPMPLSSIDKYGRSWFESNYTVPTIAHYNYDMELYGRRNSDDVRLYDEGYLDMSADWPDIESYDRGAMNDDIESVALPEELENWQKVFIVARSLHNGNEFKATLPMNPTEALDLEEATTLGKKHDYEIVEIEDSGVLERLGVDATAHSYERVETLNGLLIMAATRLSASGSDYDRVRALLNEQVSPTYLDAAGAIASVEEIPYYAYDFPNIDAHDLSSMSKEEKWGRTYYDAQAEAGELSEGKKGYEELIDIDFDIKTYGLDHDVTLGGGGYIDAYSGDELNLTFYDDEEIADAAKEAREKIGIADTQVLRDIEQMVAQPVIPAPSEPYATQYRMLSRMKGDFDYVLGEGGIGALRQIWDSDGPGSQIAYMRRLLAEIPDEYAPEWISAADIDNYEQRINELVAEQNSELLGRSESSLAAEALDEAQRIMEDLAEDLPEDEPVLNEQEVREMMEDAAMGRGEDLRAGAEERRAVRSIEEIDQGMQNVIEGLDEMSSGAPDALEELNRRVHEIDRAIVFAEIPETTYSLGIAEVSVDRSPGSETSYYVIYDSEKRHPYGHAADLVQPAVEDLSIIYDAVARHAPDAPWVKWGFRQITPWGFKDDGTPYSAAEYREGEGVTEIEELQPVLSYNEGLSVTEALQLVPNASISMLEVPILNAISDGVHNRSLGFRSRGLMSVNRNGEPIVKGGPTDNGYVYRNSGAFEDRGDDVAYIANAAWEEPLRHDENGYVRLSDIDPEHVYTYARILEACNGSRLMAERVFAELDWQHPETLYDENMRMFVEDWENADKSIVMERQPEEVRLYVECKLREQGLSGYELIRAMGMTRAGDLLGLVEHRDAEEKTLAEEMERLNRIARPWAIFAEPVAEGHRAGMVSALIDTDDPNQYTRVQVIYDYDEHPEAIGAEDSDIEASYAERWAAVYAAIGRTFPGRDYSTGEWTNSIALEEALKIAEVPDTRASELLSANRDAAATLVFAPDNFGNYNLSDELQESKVEQLEWKPGSIAVGRTTGMPYVVLAVTEDGRLRLGADLSIYDSDMFEPGGQIDEALVESYRQGRDDGTALARALAEATGRPEVGESRIEDLAREQLAKPSEEIRTEKTSGEDKGPWKVGSIAIGRQSGYAFVVMDVTEDGRLLLGADAYVASPDMFEYGGQVPDQVMDDIRSGSITEEELQEVLAEIREKAEREALTGPESEQPTWRVGSIAMDRDTRESHLVTGLTASGNILIGYDMEPVNAAAYQNVGEVDEAVALGYRNGAIDNDEKNRAMATVVSEYVTSSRDAGDLTEEEIADIERGAEEDFGDLYAHNAAMSREGSEGITFGSEEPKGTNEGLRIDPERSRWYINGREGWEFPVYVVGNNESNEPSAVCGIEMSPAGSFVAIVELNGEQRPDLSPKSSFPTFDRAREAGMASLGSALGLAPEVLAPYVHGEVAPDPYPEAWARDEGVKMTAEQIMAKYGFDPDVEYVRIYPDGQWEALYYNPQGNEERGQIVQAWGGDLEEVLTEYNPENAAWISTADGRNNDLLYDWPNGMETVLDGFMRNRQEYVGFAEGNPEAQHAYLVEREAYLESMRTLDTERSDIFEDVPGQEYQMVAVAVGDEESEHAYVANLKLGDDGWSVRVAYDNDNAFQASNGIASFEEAREKAMRMFRAGGRYDAEALDNFEGFQKDFAAVDDKSQELGRRSYESILMNDEWGWEVTPAGVGRLMDQNGEIYAEIHPDRKQVVIMDEPIPGATTWTVDNDDVRLVLEACAIQEAGLEFEPPEGATFDGLIYDVSKTLAKEESLIPPRIAGAFEPLSSRERFSNDLDELFEAYDNNLRFSPLETIYISDTPGILVSLGMEQRPIHLNALHALNIIAPKNERNSHHHGITREEMEGLPDLIARPAVITDALNGATSSDAVVLVLPGVDSDNQPLLAVIRPNEDAQYELETINMNRLASVYGKRNAENFLANAAEQGKVLYIDQKETEELSKVSQLQLLKSLAGLPFNEIIRRSSVIDKAEGRDVSETVVSAEDRPTTVDAMKVIEEANERLRAEQTAQIEESLAESDVLQHREGVVRHEEPALADRLKAAVVGALAWTVVSAPAAAAEVQTPTGTYVAQASDDLIELKGRLARSLDEALPAGWVIDDVAPSKDMLALEMTITSGEVDVELGVVAPRDKTTTTEENLDDLSSRLLEAAAEAMVGEMAAEAYIASSRRRDAKDVLGEEDLGAINAASATVETQRRGQTAYMHVGDDILAQTGDNPHLYTRLAARNGEDFFVDDNGHEIVSLKNGSIVEGEEAASRMNEMLAAYANHPNPGTVEFQNEFTYISKTLQESEIPPSTESPDMVEGNQENKGFFQRMRETFGSRRQEKESESREHSARRTDEEAATQTAVLASALAAASAMEVPMVAAAEEKSKDGGRRKVEVEGYVTRETVKNATLKSDEVEARAGAAKVKKAAPAPQQAQKRQ